MVYDPRDIYGRRYNAGLVPDYDPSGRQDASGANTPAPPLPAAPPVAAAGGAAAIYEALLNTLRQAGMSTDWATQFKDRLVGHVIPYYTNKYGDQRVLDTISRGGDWPISLAYRGATGKAYHDLIGRSYTVPNYTPPA